MDSPEAKCLTCGRSFTSFDGEDGAEAHKTSTGHVIEGYRALRVRTRRGAVVVDPFAPNPPVPKQPTRPEELDPRTMNPHQR